MACEFQHPKLYCNYLNVQEVNGPKDWEQMIISLLKQASCFGNHDATFMLSSILNYGVVVKMDELQVSLSDIFNNTVY